MLLATLDELLDERRLLEEIATELLDERRLLEEIATELLDERRLLDEMATELLDDMAVDERLDEAGAVLDAGGAITTEEDCAAVDEAGAADEAGLFIPASKPPIM